jgi:cleavage and polyadenylation specificity factor subunit 3
MCPQNRDFIRALNPPHLILVHGEKHEMDRFKAQIEREYEVKQLGFL